MTFENGFNFLVSVHLVITLFGQIGAKDVICLLIKQKLYRSNYLRFIFKKDFDFFLVFHYIAKNKVVHSSIDQTKSIQLFHLTMFHHFYENFGWKLWKYEEIFFFIIKWQLHQFWKLSLSSIHFGLRFVWLKENPRQLEKCLARHNSEREKERKRESERE